MAKNKKFTVTVNFGVGENNNKRISDEFEVVSCLIEKGAKVILDEGFGMDEIERTDKIIDRLKERGKTIVRVSEDLAFSAGPNPDLIVYKGGIGQFAALISQSQFYVGYDSMGQHVAAALEVPELVIFTVTPQKSFPENGIRMAVAKST